jgi:hypothetical protein
MRFIILPLFVLCFGSALGQGKDNSLKGVPPNERIVFGGGGGISFGRFQDQVAVMPVVGYMLTQKLIAGTGISYQYVNSKFYTPSITLQHYGVNPFAQFFFYRNIFIQSEVEYLNFEYPVSRTATSRSDFTSFLAGGGFMQPIGKRVGFYVTALYNFSYAEPRPGEFTPYNSPWVIRAGITAGRFGFF